ncbi:MAG: hypothetical protein AAF280_14735 [Pseudomonadota bacterium]
MTQKQTPSLRWTIFAIWIGGLLACLYSIPRLAVMNASLSLENGPSSTQVGTNPLAYADIAYPFIFLIAGQTLYRKRFQGPPSGISAVFHGLVLLFGAVLLAKIFFVSLVAPWGEVSISWFVFVPALFAAVAWIAYLRILVARFVQVKGGEDALS